MTGKDVLFTIEYRDMFVLWKHRGMYIWPTLEPITCTILFLTLAITAKFHIIDYSAGFPETFESHTRDTVNYSCVKFFNFIATACMLHHSEQVFKLIVEAYLKCRAFYSVEQYLQNYFNYIVCVTIMFAELRRFWVGNLIECLNCDNHYYTV